MSGFTAGIIPDRGTLLPTCLVILACFCFGTIPYFAKSLTDSGMASYAVAFYRYGLSALVWHTIRGIGRAWLDWIRKRPEIRTGLNGRGALHDLPGIHAVNRLDLVP
jgi:drug/metabolite transporter (DMT)-like permease